MAEILTNIANITEYNSWVAALPAVDDGDTHVANFTVAGDYAPADPANPAVAIRIQADDSVAYNFDSPTDAHVAFTAVSGAAFTLSTALGVVRLKGVRLETTDTSANCLLTNGFSDQLVTLELCRIKGGAHGIVARDLSSDEINTLNCVFSGQRLSGVYTKRSASTHERTVVVDSNTDSNAFHGGFYCRVGTTLTNCVAYNNNNKDFPITGATLLNCASGDSTAYGTSPVTGVTAPDFTNSASDIWTTASGGILEGAGTGGTDIGLELTASDSIMITSPVEWFLQQRNTVTDDASITVTGVYSGVTVPTSIEYSYAGSSYAVLDAAPSGGNFTGNIIIPSGNGTLTVRYSNDTGVTTFVNNIAVGIKCLFWGQSNFVGVATNAQSYTATAGMFHKYTVTNDLWEEGNDPFLTATNLGSLFPLLANHFVNNKSVPVGFVGVAAGSTNLSQWQAGQTLNTRMLDYLTGSGGNSVEVIASWIGESDASQGTLEATFKSEYNAVIDQLETLTGAKSLLCGIAEAGANQDDVRQWIEDISNTNPNVTGYVDMNLVYQGLHYTTDQEATNVAQALYDGLDIGFYSTTLNLSITGIPDGSFMTVLDLADGTRIQRQNEVYSAGSASILLLVPAGATIKGYVDDALDPSSNGAYIEGVTV